jgi:hypothetical protein
MYRIHPLDHREDEQRLPHTCARPQRGQVPKCPPRYFLEMGQPSREHHGDHWKKQRQPGYLRVLRTLPRPGRNFDEGSESYWLWLSKPIRSSNGSMYRHNIYSFPKLPDWTRWHNHRNIQE